MKRSNKSIAMILAGTMLLGGAGTALAYGGYNGKGECDHHGSPMRALSKIDNLTDEQRSQIKTLFKQQRSTMLDQKDTMRESRQALRDAMDKGASREEIQVLAKKQGEQVTAMIMARQQMREKLNAILTEAQQVQLKKMQQERMQERHDRSDDDERGRW